MMSAKESKGNTSRFTLEEIVSGKEEISDEEEDSDPAEEWVKTSYIYDITMPYYEVITEKTDDVTTAYDYGIERISAVISNFWSSCKEAYVYDGRGSVAQGVYYDVSWYTIDTPLSRFATVSKSYTPFGEQLGDKLSGYGYNGEYYDAATGMVNLRARQYEPAMMRFAQKDTVRGDVTSTLSQNRYLYVENNPANFTDPSGMFLSELWNGIKSVAKKVINTVATVATKVVSNVKTVVKKAAQLTEKVVNKVESIANTAKTDPQKALNEFGQAVAGGLEYIKNTIPTIKNKIQNNVNSLANIIGEAKDDISSNLNEVGKNAIDDMIRKATAPNGLYDSIDAAALEAYNETYPITYATKFETGGRYYVVLTTDGVKYSYTDPVINTNNTPHSAQPLYAHIPFLGYAIGSYHNHVNSCEFSGLNDGSGDVGHVNSTGQFLTGGMKDGSLQKLDIDGSVSIIANGLNPPPLSATEKAKWLNGLEDTWNNHVAEELSRNTDTDPNNNTFDCYNRYQNWPN